MATSASKGTASLAGSSHTWWTGGTGEGKLTAPDGTSVSHTQNGDRTSSATLTSDWVFAGGGWQEQQTVLDSSGASKGSFSSSMNQSWNVAGVPSQDGEGTYSKGSHVTSATGSHDYTSSSKLTRTANATGGFAVTGWRKGGGESHGTSSVHYDDYDTYEAERTMVLDANDSYDYTNDLWEITFDATGMPRIQYSGELETQEVFATKTTENWGFGNVTNQAGFSNDTSRTRSASTDAGPGFVTSGGRGLYASGFYDTSFPAFFHGYGNSFSVDGAGYGYNESKAVPGAFGGGQVSALLWERTGQAQVENLCYGESDEVMKR